MVTEYTTGRRRRSRGAPEAQQEVTLPLAYPPGRARVTIVALRLLLVPVVGLAVYVLANYPVGKYGLHTDGSVADAWVAAVVMVAVYGVGLVLDGRSLRATADGITVRGGLKQHEFAWADVAGVAHTETGLTITDHDGGTHTIQLIERDARTKIVMRTTPMVRLAADLERARLQVRAPRALISQVRVGPVRLTAGEWGVWVLVAVIALAVAMARTAGVPALQHPQWALSHAQTEI